MQPSSAEAAEGVTLKRLTFNFPNSTTWVHHSFPFEEGLWDWRVNNMWQTGDFEETPTELVSIQWFFCSYFGVNIGDEMLVDGLCFQTQESSVLTPRESVRLLPAAPKTHH